MPTLTELLGSARTAAQALIAESPDRCSIYNRTYTSDSAGGTTPVDGSPVASNVPIIYTERTYSSSQIAGGSQSHVTHDLFLLPSAAAVAVKPNYVIVVAARNLTGVLTFEQPVLIDDTFDILVHIGAMLKK
jgi:hypothetical protein